MKRYCAAALVVAATVCGVSRAGAQDIRELSSVIDLDVTIKSLAVAVENGVYEAPAKYFLLNGTLDSVFEVDEASGTVIIEMVTGEWIGTQDVRSYHCLIQFTGDEYVRLFPRTVPRDAGPEVFAKSARLLVMAYPYSVVDLTDGRTLWLLDGVYLRRL